MACLGSDCILGDLLGGNEYKDQIDGFRKKFVRAKEAFDRSIALTTFVAIDGIGKHCSHMGRCLCLNLPFFSADHSIDVPPRKSVGV